MCLLVFCLGYQAANTSLNIVSAGEKFMTNPCISFEAVLLFKFKIWVFQSSKDFYSLCLLLHLRCGLIRNPLHSHNLYCC